MVYFLSLDCLQVYHNVFRAREDRKKKRSTASQKRSRAKVEDGEKRLDTNNLMSFNWLCDIDNNKNFTYLMLFLLISYFLAMVLKRIV